MVYQDSINPENMLEKTSDGKFKLSTGRGNITATIRYDAGGQPIYEWDSDKVIKVLAVNENNPAEFTTYNFKLLQAPESFNVPDKLVEYCPAPGQFTNDDRRDYNSFARRISLGLAGWDDCISLGDFGGYAVYQYDSPIFNDSKNPYGVDFIVYGNNFGSSCEPGQVWVSEDGEKWYALAGSMHYETSTKWAYTKELCRPDRIL